ncbi:hypothetical protein AB0I22_19830 [Streptomyces sp. NPDC050610]
MEEIHSVQEPHDVFDLDVREVVEMDAAPATAQYTQNCTYDRTCNC